MTVLENVMLAPRLVLRKALGQDAANAGMLEKVGLADKDQSFPAIYPVVSNNASLLRAH